MLSSNFSTLTVLPGMRNQRGCFVQDTAYQLRAIDHSVWALICMDAMSCHDVDPDDLCAGSAG